MAPTIRRRLGAAALAAVIGVGGTALTSSATASFDLQRRAGSDRYATASAVAADAFTTANDAVIARGDGTPQQFADALAGSYLAGALGGGAPLLLTQRDALPSATKSRLTTLGVKNVTILGGTGAVTAAVESELEKDFTVTRIQGNDRYDTAAKIASSQAPGQIGQINSKRTAFLATGVDAADALAAGPLSFNRRLPILLTRPTALPAVTKAAIADLGITHVVVLGGTNAVSTAVENEVKAAGATTERVQGTNRYDTAAKVADFALAKLTGWSNSSVDIANGLNPADALAGGPVAGKASRAILLTAPTTLPGPTRDWLAKLSPTLTTGRIFGGTAAVSSSVETAAETAGRGSARTVGQVVAVDKANNRYTHVPPGASEGVVETYTATDTFTVDGQTADLGGFEAELTVADDITVVVSGATKQHRLVNQPPPTSGMVGNVDLADDQYDIIHELTGDALAVDRVYASTNTFTIDGVGGKTLAQFEADLSEGDTIAVSGTSLFLTNRAVEGKAGTVTKSSVPPSARFPIGPFGDNPATGSGGPTDSAGNDDAFIANGEPGSTDVFFVDGGTATFTQFNDALSQGDDVTYTRVGGVETFRLVNAAPETVEGQAKSGLNKNGSQTVADDNNDGGTFTMVSDGKDVPVTYRAAQAGDQFYVNGALSNEANFEARYSAGDTIRWRPADAPSGTGQRLELTDQPLAGQISKDSINTGETPTVSNPSRPANSYAVLAANSTTIELGTAVYFGGTTAYDGTTITGHAYSINGAPADLTAFENALTAIKAGSQIGTVVVTVSGTTQNHALTTAAAT